ncbi:hypothetical protein OG252_28285 [Streptomyces sp. NBC_01352]|uniref:hypothetical protein n=1 Tax=Streptomyces sp. NBC_01352 TaxID=2903834 RepID=UPI002E348F47|nr:hypothetical protein [Streptomyces sp. NBC_01352]
MRIRATVAAVTGALALSALVVPAAQAADASSSYRTDATKAFTAAHAAGSGNTAFSTTADPTPLDATFSNLKIAAAVKVGTTNKVATTVTYTMTHGADVDITSDDFATGPYIYKGSYDNPSNILFGDEPATCTATSSTTASCKGDIDIYPADGDLVNTDAGTWSAGALALTYSNSGYADQGGLGTTKVQRYSKLTVNAGPEPVYKGKTITSTGKLSRANWEDGHYHGYTNQPVKLQFRKAGTSTYTTVKTVYSDSYGNLKATATAAYDGYWRFSFAGTTTTPAVSATGDYVDVR